MLVTEENSLKSFSKLLILKLLIHDSKLQFCYRLMKSESPGVEPGMGIKKKKNLQMIVTCTSFSELMAWIMTAAAEVERMS